MRLLLIIAVFFITYSIVAQHTDTSSTRNNPPYIADARIPMHDLKAYSYLFVDSSNKLTIQDIASEKLIDSFQPLTGMKQPAQPYISYWVKLSISASGTIQNWWLLLNDDTTFRDSDAMNSYVDAWFLNEAYQVTKHQRTGLLVPRSQKAIEENPGLNRILFSLKEGEKTHVYLKIYNEYDEAIISSPQLRNPIIGFAVENAYLMTATGTIIFVFSILSFFFFIFLKEKSYLLFGIYTLFVSIHYLILHPELPFVNWFIPEHPGLAVPAFSLFAIGGWMSFVLFGRFFINLPKLSRQLDAILKWVVAVWLVCLFTGIILTAVTHRATFVRVNFIFIPLFIIFLIRIAFFKSILVRFYVAGGLWLVCFIILGVLQVQTPFLSPFPIGQLGQILIYVAGLSYKMRLNEKEKDEARIVRIRNAELANLYEESNRQKEEIELQKTNAEEALVELKAAQSQLIQSEKMASLGELTAGIAHEIQNPLNFVNNFSEVNKELLMEMKDEMDKGNLDDAKEIANDVIDNEQKINHHGKRAEAIVKGMLQHSRSSSGVKELTNINALTDEYLRLAYHGLRAKDKSFNATLKTDYDETIGNINIISQDIGRAILNLITNAFYAASLPSKGGFKDPHNQHNPTVYVSTKKMGDKMLLSVKDNGSGISQNVLDKIFQPFFTTKPTGQGTGLGLSLAYDIVRAHGGELKVITKEGEGSEFIIQLPITTITD